MTRTREQILDELDALTGDVDEIHDEISSLEPRIAELRVEFKSSAWGEGSDSEEPVIDTAARLGAWVEGVKGWGADLRDGVAS